MRSRLLFCLLPLLLVSCSSVRVMPEGPGAVQHGAPGDLPPLVRGDRARTQDFPPAGEDGYRPPARLAVLLPLSGTLAAAGASVRDGFLSAYYAETRTRPAVKFYDSAGSASGAQSALSRAVNEGAQMIVGPLTREEVNAVLAQGDGSLPTIALNRGTRKPPPGTTSFALLPDEEGAAAARRLGDRRLDSVLIFSNRSDSAQRAVTAFREAILEDGGGIAGEINVTSETPDLGAQLAGFQAGAKPPRAVFLSLDAGQARAIAAQLKISALAALPRIATSQILSGSNARADIELDGIEYPELPWMLGQGGALPEATALGKTLPSARGPGQRLFAFGADAWKLAANFERLYNDPSYSIRGATGVLQIDVSGPVRRTPAWAVFSGGRGRAAGETSRTSDVRQPGR